MSYCRYIFILILCAILLPGFAQSGLGTSPCNGGDVEAKNDNWNKYIDYLISRLNAEDYILDDNKINLDSSIRHIGYFNPDNYPSNTAVIQSTQPMDPNEIIGLEGYDAPESMDTLRWVAATQSLAYTIYFENDPELAMAAASKVTITLPVHPKLNYATFGVGSFGFGSYVFPVNGSPSSYQTRIDLRDSMGIYLDVVAGLDIVRHEAFWIFQSIDPATGLPPADIHLGFLPINDSLHSGEGFVSFTIKPKTGMCITGDTVTATASIVFDINEPIATNTWLHTIDAVAPTSTLAMTPNAAADTLVATFTGEDDAGGCGIKQYKLYYSINDNAYQLYDVYPIGEMAEVPMETGMEYRFFVLAEDHVGNCEPMKSQPEYTIGTNFVTLAVNSFPAEAGLTTGAGTYSMNATAELTATASEGYHFVNWMNQGVPVSTQNTYTVDVTQNQTYTAYFERNAYTLQTLAADGSTITVTDLNGNEIPSGSTVLHADRIVVQTSHETCYDLIGSSANGVTFVSGDTLTVTGELTISTLTNPLFNTGDTIAFACNSFNWYEYTGITQSCENLTHTFTNAAGCDSVVTLHLTVNATTYGDTSATVCGSFDWYSYTGLTESGDYTHTMSNTAGCDSVVTLHLTVNATTYGDTTATVCGSFDWYSHTNLTESGEYTHTMSNAAGCDSVVTLHLTVNATTYGDTSATVCGSFDWYSHTNLTESGEYTHTMSNAAGCDSVVTLHLTVNTTTYGDTSATVCGSFDWYEHTNLTQSGDYTHTFTTVAGCDSVVTLHLTVNTTTYGDTTATACGSFDWYSYTNLTESGEYTHTMSNAAGCDSVVTLHLTVNTTTYGDTSATVCGSFDWYEHTNLTESGDYTHTFTTAMGCDSVVTLHLTVNTTTYGDTSATVCGSFDWYEHTNLTQSGDYMHSFTTAAGCDSIVTLHLTVNTTTYGDTSATVCGSFDWYEHTNLTQSGDYTHTFTTTAGCDSVVTLHLTINQQTSGIDEQTACDSYTWIDGTIYTESTNTPTFTLSNAAGCDSVVTLHLTVNESINSEFSIVTEDSCYIWNDQTYCETGDYVQTFETTDGCDSVVTLHLTITVGISDYSVYDFKLYPNPTKDIVNVQFTVHNIQLSDVEIQIFDMYGKLLDVVKVRNTDVMNTSAETQIDLSQYTNGVYLIKAIADGNMLAVRKVVKK